MNGTLARDRIEYEIGFGVLGAVAQKVFVGRELAEPSTTGNKFWKRCCATLLPTNKFSGGGTGRRRHHRIPSPGMGYALVFTVLEAVESKAPLEIAYCCRSCCSVLYAFWAAARSPDCRSCPNSDRIWETPLSWLPPEWW